MIAAQMPWHDWQFYLVTALALAGLWLGLRPLLRQRSKPGCSGCKSALPNTDRLVTLGRRPRT